MLIFVFLPKTAPANTPIVISQLSSRKDPIKFVPTAVPNRPNVRIIQRAIALWFVGNRRTAVPDTIDITGPPNDKKDVNIMKVTNGFVTQKSDKPQRPDENKKKPEIFMLDIFFQGILE